MRDIYGIKDVFSFCGNVLMDLGLFLNYGVWIAPRWGLELPSSFYTGLHPVLVISPRWGLEMH
jgi:hypothetical protein